MLKYYADKYATSNDAILNHIPTSHQTFEKNNFFIPL